MHVPLLLDCQPKTTETVTIRVIQ